MRIPSIHAQPAGSRENDVMTPMIDVVFLLLVFFMCAAAGQVRESVLPTEMTAAGSVESSDPVDRDPWNDEVWLALHRDASGRTLVGMNQRRFSEIAELAGPLHTLADLSREIPVILDVDAQVPMQDVISVYDLCRAAGFESVNFAADADALKK
ncbi:MAG: biopolymer transporter ExbD [Planctomycetaceae bacterium]|nr:biopolymer transporter ExbD [Planctomycetaceae bacterium]